MLSRQRRMAERRARKWNQLAWLLTIEPLPWESLDLPKRAVAASLRGFVEATGAHRRSTFAGCRPSLEHHPEGGDEQCQHHRLDPRPGGK